MADLAQVLKALLALPDFVLEFAFDLVYVSGHRFELPDCLANWIDHHMPALRGVRSVNFYCMSAGDLPIGPLFESRLGLTLGDHVGLSSSYGMCPLNACNFAQVETLLHELVHVEQYRTDPGYFGRYVIEFLIGIPARPHAYWDHPYEVAARDRAAALIAEYRHDDPCHCREQVAPEPGRPGGDVPPGETPAPPTGGGASDARNGPSMPPDMVESRRKAGLCDRPRITFFIIARGAERRVTVRAASLCGVKLLRVEQALALPDGTQVPFATAVSEGACLEYRIVVVTRSIHGDARLRLDVTAESCVGDRSQSTLYTS